MASTGEETGFLLKYGGAILGAIATVVTTVGGWLFRRVVQKHDEDIASLKKGIADVDAKVDHKLDTDVWEQNRRESRDNVIALHDKIEEIGRDGETRHRELMNILLTQRSNRRAGDN
jgi:hypothetical protein